MGYSRITEVEIFNFMSFSHARIVFDETNILNLKGYNDSGKSAILRAVEVCLADMYKRAQVKYIRYGCEYFRVVVTFEDGISILRDKYLNGQSLYEMYKDGKVIYTTKQGSKLTRIEGVPATIEKYLGLCVTENGCLNFQSCSDRLLLVETTGSENYQEFNAVLKSSEISRATALINSDRNAMNSRMIEMENEYNSSEAVLKSRSDVDEDVIALVQERDIYSEELLGKESDMKNINELITTLSSIQQIPEVPTLDVGKMKDLEDIIILMDKYSSLEVLPKVEQVDSKKLSDISGIYNLLEEYGKLERLPVVEAVNIEEIKDIQGIMELLEKAEALPDPIPEVKPISSTLMSMSADMDYILNVLQNAEELKENLMVIQKENKGLTDKLNTIIEDAKKQGIDLFMCPHCGAYSEIPHAHAIG